MCPADGFWIRRSSGLAIAVGSLTSDPPDFGYEGVLQDEAKVVLEI